MGYGPIKWIDNIHGNNLNSTYLPRMHTGTHLRVFNSNTPYEVLRNFTLLAIDLVLFFLPIVLIFGAQLSIIGLLVTHHFMVLELFFHKTLGQDGGLK
jgi:hypothetical protein